MKNLLFSVNIVVTTLLLDISLCCFAVVFHFVCSLFLFWIFHFVCFEEMYLRACCTCSTNILPHLPIISLFYGVVVALPLPSSLLKLFNISFTLNSFLCFLISVVP